jgi:DNA-binding transcriptional regulator GbsR (MarR family)
MYFYDETDDWPEYKIVKDEIHRLEMADQEIRKKLRQTESASLADPSSENLKAKVEELKKELKVIEKKLNDSLSMYR